MRLAESNGFQRPGSWSPDGSVLAFFEESRMGTHLTLVFNWFEDLKARLAPRR